MKSSVKSRTRLDDLAKWRIAQMVKFGGFSRKLIASMVFDKPLHRVTSQDVSCIGSFMTRNNLHVRDWRDGLSAQAVHHAKVVSRPKRKRRKTVRLAA